MKNIVIFTDGGCWPNPGPGVCAAVLVQFGNERDEPTFEIIAERSRALGPNCTNNTAEYSGLILGIELAGLVGAVAPQFVMDSQLVVEQVMGRFSTRDTQLVGFLIRAKRLLKRLPGGWTIEHVKRSENKRADWLCDVALGHKKKRRPEAAPPVSRP